MHESIQSHIQSIFPICTYDKLQRKWIADEQEWLHTSGVGADAAEPREWRRKGAHWEDGAVQESHNLFSRNTANCQSVEMRLIQNILLQVFVKHHIGVKIIWKERPTFHLMKFCLINANRSIYSGVRCQKISFRRTVRIRALTEPWNCTLLDEKGKKQYSIHFTCADKDMEKLQCYLGTFYIRIHGWLKR